jgi:uncharacterized protein
LASRAALAALLIALAACNRGPRVVIVAPGGKMLAIVHVEVADTAGTRELGLMYRNHLDEDAGMLFVFPAPAHQRFWMKNTEIPLDMIFADSDGRVIGVVANAAPYSESMDSVNGRSQYVLEVNGGFARGHGIGAGARFKFEGFTPRAEF